MIHFIKKTFLFLVVSVCSILTLLSISLLIVKKEASFKVDSHIKNIIIGHSHSECAFNDSIINKTKNVSISGEAYFYSYSKIKKILNQNNQVENVFLEFTNNSLSEDLNRWIWDNKHLSQRFSLYLPFLNKNDIKIIYKNNKGDFVQALSNSFRKSTETILFKNYNYIEKTGGYKALENRLNDSLINKYLSERINHKKFRLSQINFIYLKKIIKFCHKKNIAIYFIRSPQHKQYEDRLEEESFIRIKKKYFQNVELLDFNDFPLKNNQYADLGHLNYKGAKKFSKWFNNLLESGLLKKEDKTSFIKNKLELLKRSEQ